MTALIHDDFMLDNELAVKLYHTYAKDLPIIDYHCHLDPKTIYENKTFSSLGEVWLGGDHYKWRLMRTYGIPETHVTGEASFDDKLYAYAKVVPEMFGNPVFHWTHLELKRFFDVDEMLTPDNVHFINARATSILASLTPQKVMDKFHVAMVGTTDDPLDSLEYHEKLSASTLSTKVLPTFRPDKVVNIELDFFLPWMKRFETLMKHPITSLEILKKDLIQRLDHFVSHGALLSDHALDLVVFEHGSEEDVNAILQKRLNGSSLSVLEVAQYKANLLIFFAQEYAKRNIVQQYHIGAYRNTNARRLADHGPDTGFDSIHDQPIIIALSKLLDTLYVTHQLPKTILYTLNPNAFDVIVPLMQSFQGEERGRLQFGSAWWFLDNIDGMRRQMRAYMNYGLFSTFIGMLTDSRSFLSYPRHEYFRRLLCQVVSEEVMNGYYPYDEKRLGALIQNISYYNAKNYFHL